MMHPDVTSILVGPAVGVFLLPVVWPPVQTVNQSQ